MQQYFLDDKNVGKTPFRDKVTTAANTRLSLCLQSATSQLTIWQGKVAIGRIFLRM